MQPDDYVVVLDTPAYQHAYHHPTAAFEADAKLVRDRLGSDKRHLISIKLESKAGSATPHDARPRWGINQWQNQAQYEMGKAEICGFRLIEDREGEIELVLYYSEEMPQRGRASFQELFERFLYQREVEVTRFPPVVCPEGHRLERATVIRLIREDQTFAFCAKCGGRVDLPDLDKPGIGTSASAWLQREEAAARLRSTYELHLSNVKSYRRGWATPHCYLSRAPGQETYAEKLMHDLQGAGVYLIERRPRRCSRMTMSWCWIRLLTSMHITTPRQHLKQTPNSSETGWAATNAI